MAVLGSGVDQLLGQLNFVHFLYWLISIFNDSNMAFFIHQWLFSLKPLCKIWSLYWLLSFVNVWDTIEFFSICFNEAHLVPQATVLLIIQSLGPPSILHVVRSTLNRSSFWVETILLICISCVYWRPFTYFQGWLVMKVLPSQINLLNLLDCLLFLILICRVVGNTVCCSILTVAFLLVQACRPLLPFLL